MIKLRYKSIAILILSLIAVQVNSSVQWPASPDAARVVLVDEIRCEDLKPKSGFFGKLSRIIGGKVDQDNISLPFDIIAVDDKVFAICQNLPALVEIDKKSNDFRLHQCKSLPLKYPVAITRGSGRDLFVTDSEQGVVYRFRDGKLKPFITDGLKRPTGIAVSVDNERVYVVDTKAHRLRIFDFDGKPVDDAPLTNEPALHYPTFASMTKNGSLLINDALNYRIRLLDPDGNQLSSFGSEGDSPGFLSRPKGVATDSDNNIYVVDNLQDIVQVFNLEGRLLLVIGGSGSDSGQFWSPSGLDIENDMIYIADTFNNRIQILRYLGEEK